jgi:hypothetical protein
MRAINRAAWGTGLALAACVMSLPVTATAQGTYPKTGTVERKIVRKSDQKVAQKIRRTTRRGTIVERRRILCGDGTWSVSGAACANHDGVAARQVEVRRVTPVASVRARERANVNSAVVRRAYVNRTRAGAIARCTDGTYWHARTRTSACVNHCGVANWL